MTTAALSRRRFPPAAPAATSPAPAVSPPPNILCVYPADDPGIGDPGRHSRRLIAAVQLSARSARACGSRPLWRARSPARPRARLDDAACTLTARTRDSYNRRGERVRLRPDDFTVAQLLRQTYYRTAPIGKRRPREAGTRGRPTRQAFDEFDGFLNQDYAAEF